MVNAGREGLVPADLAVVMGVDVDKTGQQMGPVSSNGALRVTRDAAHIGDATVLDRHVSAHRLCTRAINNRGAPYQQVMHGTFLSLSAQA